jgi:lipoprotein-releasing system ATP-binding protein
MSEPVLKADALRKNFVSGTRSIDVLRGASLVLQAGEHASIRGASGSGKTTLLNLLSCIETPDTGAVWWGGQRVDDQPRARLAPLRAQQIGFVFQFFYLIPELTAIENIVIAGRMAGQARATAAAAAEELLVTVGLQDRRNSLATELSGGERQRIALARALINKPALLLADEPTGNLDEDTARRVMDVLLTVSRERQTALLLVTHNAAFAMEAESRYLLHSGLLERV